MSLKSSFPLGVYVGSDDADSPALVASYTTSIASFTTLVGESPLFADSFIDADQTVPQWLSNVQWAAAAWGATPVSTAITPVIAMPFASFAAGSATADQMFQGYIAGQYDSLIIAGVKAWAQAGFTTQYWRPGWEMNLLNTMPWGTGNNASIEADYVAAFQHVYTVLHQAGTTFGVNVQVIWNPGITNSGVVNAATTLFPGANYVDAIGADVYQIDSPTAAQVASGQSLTLQDLINLAAATGKPLALPEVGNKTNSPAFAQWLAQTLAQSSAQIAFVNLWDSGSFAFTGPTANQPALAAAFAEYFGSNAVNSLLGSIAGSVLNGTTGVCGAAVALLSSTGAVVATTTTNSAGAFSFASIAAGTYQVNYAAPSGLVLQCGSQASLTTGLTSPITVAIGQAVSLPAELMLSSPATIDAAVLHFGAGTDPVGGSPQAGVTVSLLNSSSTVIATTVSNSAGAVSFGNLAAGTYQLSYAPLAGQAIEPGTAATTAAVTLAAGQTVNAPSGNVITLAMVSGSALLVGVADAGVSAALLNAANTTIASTTTAADGTFSFANLLPGSYSVKYTAPKGQYLQTGSQANISTGVTAPFTLAASQVASLPAETLLTNPAIIQAGAKHFGGATDPVWGGADAGVVVQLLNSAGQVIATSACNTGGWMEFQDLAPGTYQVQYQVPTGQALYAGTSALMAPITVTAGQNIMAPAGEFISLASIGGKVTAGGAAVAGMALTLLSSTGSVVATTTTASTGAFSFLNLAAGSYQVRYTPPQGLVLQTGSEAKVTTGLSPMITVATGQAVTLPAESLLSNPASVSANVLNFVGTTNATPTGAVTASLLNGAGQVIATALTNSTGKYSFGQLAAGIYQVQYSAPTGAAIKPATVGLTAPFTLGAGQSVWAPSASQVSAISMTGSGKSVTESAGSYLVTGTASHSTLTLGAGDDTITLTGTGHDTVHAAGGNVTISATGAGNLFDAGAGMAFLTSDGSAGNIFMLNQAAAASMTTITGFNLAAGDILDIKRTLTGTAGSLANIASYITSATTGANTTLYVDPTGNHGTSTAFAVLNGVHTTAAALQAAHGFSLN
jgi:hypothetical protein